MLKYLFKFPRYTIKTKRGVKLRHLTCNDSKLTESGERSILTLRSLNLLCWKKRVTALPQD